MTILALHELQPPLTSGPSLAFGWLIRPAVGSTRPEDRRAHLLAWLLLFVLVLQVAALLLVLITLPAGNPRRVEYIVLILGLWALAVLAFGLNWSGHYGVSSGMTVALAAIGPWGSAMLDPTVSQGDFVPLVYVVLPVLLSSILLSPSVTGVLAAMQVCALALMSRYVPATASINWASLISFVVFTSVLCVSADMVSRRDLAQIDEQTRQLAASEARLRTLSVSDPLTGLFNRRYMEETLNREVGRAQREQTTLAIIMLDVDHFKRFNDTLGHAAGDAVLQGLGELLSRTVRAGDVACRYGGEEFVLILPGVSLEVAKVRADRLREAVKNLHLEHNGQTLAVITVSLGVALFPDHGEDGESVLEAADSALYRAKDMGRNQVVTAGWDRRRAHGSELKNVSPRNPT